VRTLGSLLEPVDAQSGRLRSGLRSGAGFGSPSKTDSEIAAPERIGPPHAPGSKKAAHQSANGSAVFDFPQGDRTEATLIA
jgi:hypothetical protein